MPRSRLTKAPSLITQDELPTSPQRGAPNSVIHALVVALLEVEQQRDRGMVRRPMNSKGPE